MDPLTLLAGAQAAYGALKAGVAAGKELEGLVKDIAHLMGTVSDLTKVSAEPPKRGWASKGSAEQIALEAFTARKKAEELQYEIRGIIVSRYGPKAWDEILKMVMRIRKEQREEAERKARRRAKIVEAVLFWLSVLFIVVLGTAGMALTIFLLMRR